MRKAAVICALLMILLSGCAGKTPDFDTSQVPPELVGQWQCDEYASDNETATGFYAMYVEQDGQFSLYDTVGNPGISGTMLGSDGHVLVLCNDEDFDPPFCWDMDTEAVLDYEADDGQIRLGYDGVWLTFTREEM